MTKPTANANFPTFPQNIICGLARDFVELYADIREVPPQSLWISFVTYLGCLVSPCVRLAAASSEPRFFAAIIGRSARTRKSTANNLAKEAFKGAFPEPTSIGGEKAAIHVVEGFGSSEGLLWELAVHPSIPTIVYLDEINILAQKTGGDGTIGISAFNKLYEDHDYTHPLAQGNGPRVRGAYLAMVGAGTIEDFTDTWKGKHANAGFFSRLLLVGADDPVVRIAIPKDPNPTALKSLVGSLQALYADVRHSPRNYQFAPEAEEAWGLFYVSMGEGEEWNRIETYGMRLMAIQTLLKGEELVTRETVLEVIDFLNYEVAVRQILAPVIADNQIAEVEQKILRALQAAKRLSKRDLERKICSWRKGTQLFRQACNNLEVDGKIAIAADPKHKFFYSLVQADEAEAEDVFSTVIRDTDDSTAEISHCN